NGDWEFEVVIERKQDHEDDEQSQWPDDFHLVLRLEKFTVLAAPGNAIARRQAAGDVGDGALSVFHCGLQIASFDAVLHADVARAVLAVDEGCAAGFMDIRQLAERDLLTGRRSYQKIADLPGVLAESRLHTDDEVE